MVVLEVSCRIPTSNAMMYRFEFYFLKLFLVIIRLGSTKMNRVAVDSHSMILAVLRINKVTIFMLNTPKTSVQ